MILSSTSDIPIERLSARAFRIPTDAPEADGTFQWNATTLVLVEVIAGGKTGIGYTYSGIAAADVVNDVLLEVVRDEDAFNIPKLWLSMVRAVRNLGWRGLSANAISAVDCALWDLKAKLLGLPLVRLLGAERMVIPIYGSGGFTSYDDDRLREQLRRWVVRDGCKAVKMKVGGQPERDLERARIARSAINQAELYVDANGALSRKQALHFAQRFADFGVTWFEEPVSSDDLSGLRLLRDRSPPGMEVVAGEYGYETFYFRQMLDAEAVDVMQVDGTRCGGITGFMRAAALADAYGLPLSTNTAPALHLAMACAAPRLKNIEWYYDHVRVEQMLFDGAPVAKDGSIRPDLGRLGFGLQFKEADAQPFAL